MGIVRFRFDRKRLSADDFLRVVVYMDDRYLLNAHFGVTEGDTEILNALSKKRFIPRFGVKGV